VRGDDRDGLANAGTRPAPLLRPQSRESRRRVGRADELRDTVHLVDGHVEAVVAGVAELEVVAVLVADGPPHDAREPRDAVLGVDDEVAGLHLREEARAMARALAQRPALLHEAKELA